MRGMNKLLAIVFVLVIAVAVAWFNAGRADGPVITISEPALVGQIGRLNLTVTAPRARLTRLDVVLEQGDTRTPLFSLDGDPAAELVVLDADSVRLTRPIGRGDLPELRSGTARITVRAVRPVLFGYREAATSASHEFEVRLIPPQISVQSTFHYINHGGSEMVVYRVNPPVTHTGVRVGDYEYPGYPASGAGVEGADPGLHVAFFAMLWDQDVNTPIRVYARDDVGNEGTAAFDSRVFPRNFRRSTITVNDAFLERVVPAILQQTPELEVDDPTDLLGSYLRINRDLRRINNEAIQAAAADTAHQILWHGPFRQLINTAVEAGFADQRTYVYNGEEIDFQVHLGFDLASTVNAPVLAANRGLVTHAGWLGIYGNTVILDHGMGLQTLYSHLSSIAVNVGDMVELNSQLGRTGITGLAGGDHLHFTTLLHGRAVTPIDWWSSQWVEDRILRKLRDAGATVP
jgi:murein DD-endopeptidase MepM/ murein hydrolase activator NlpD